MSDLENIGRLAIALHIAEQELWQNTRDWGRTKDWDSYSNAIHKEDAARTALRDAIQELPADAFQKL